MQSPTLALTTGGSQQPEAGVTYPVAWLSSEALIFIPIC